MNKFFILLLITFISGKLFSQVPILPNLLPSPKTNGYEEKGYYRADSGWLSGSRDTMWRPIQTGSVPVGAMIFWQNSYWARDLVNNVWYKMVGNGDLSDYMRKSDSALYATRNKLRNDSLVLRTAINAKLNILDTSAMLSVYLRKSDTTSISNRINTKLNVVDTINMLTPYLRKIDTLNLSNRIITKLNISDTSLMLSPYFKKVDTVSMSNRINGKLNLSDTSLMLSSYLRKTDTASLSTRINNVQQALIDTAEDIRSAIQSNTYSFSNGIINDNGIVKWGGSLIDPITNIDLNDKTLLFGRLAPPTTNSVFGVFSNIAQLYGDQSVTINSLNIESNSQAVYMPTLVSTSVEDGDSTSMIKIGKNLVQLSLEARGVTPRFSTFTISSNGLVIKDSLAFIGLRYEPSIDYSILGKLDSSWIPDWRTVVREVNSSLGTAIPTFTAGSIPFAAPSGRLTENNSQLNWDNTNNRLGIGVSPAVTLHVNGIGRFNTIQIVNTGTLSNATANNGSISFATAGLIAQRNVADNNAALKIDLVNLSAGGPIAEFRKGGVSRSFVNNGGLLQYVGGSRASEYNDSTLVAKKYVDSLLALVTSRAAVDTSATVLATTTDATPTTILTMPLHNGHMYGCKITVTAISSTNDGAFFNKAILVRGFSNIATIRDGGMTDYFSPMLDASLTGIDVDAITSGNSIVFRVIGVVATNITWKFTLTAQKN